jgi:hypothetical protein
LLEIGKFLVISFYKSKTFCEVFMRIDLKISIIKSGLRNDQVERQAKIPLTKLSRFISGALDPKPDEAERVASVLGKKIEEIFPDSRTLQGVA